MLAGVVVVGDVGGKRRKYKGLCSQAMYGLPGGAIRFVAGE